MEAEGRGRVESSLAEAAAVAPASWLGCFTPQSGHTAKLRVRSPVWVQVGGN